MIWVSWSPDYLWTECRLFKLHSGYHSILNSADGGLSSHRVTRIIRQALWWKSDQMNYKVGCGRRGYRWSGSSACTVEATPLQPLCEPKSNPQPVLLHLHFFTLMQTASEKACLVSSVCRHFSAVSVTGCRYYAGLPCNTCLGNVDGQVEAACIVGGLSVLWCAAWQEKWSFSHKKYHGRGEYR